jgi:putative oxidoreductase
MDQSPQTVLVSSAKQGGNRRVDKWHRQSTLRIRALSHTDELAATWSDFLLLVGRLLLGWLFFASGYGKLGNIAGTAGYFTSLGMSPPEFLAWFAGFAEVILGVALILGIATRYAALASFAWLLVSTAIAHRYWTYPPSEQFSEYNKFPEEYVDHGRCAVRLRHRGRTLLARRNWESAEYEPHTMSAFGQNNGRDLK